MKRPYITVKFAQTLDGRIAARDGSSKWISSSQSREFAHRLRAQNDAILVGVNTVLIDDPALTVRYARGTDPVRLIIDSRLRTPIDSRVVKETGHSATIIITTRKASSSKIKKLRSMGVGLIITPFSKDGDIDLKKAVRVLYKRGIRSILVEGGQKIITSFLSLKMADKVIAIISPKIVGKGIESVGDLGVSNIKGAIKLRIKRIEKLGGDIIYSANPIR
ncbi:MAG: bifunctional diaminohydroxyphosphoribosylaminopyrimidine deaminase/5-amino-6-(5-phosphoribosylamino)uracil reductase RibD [Candidatus Omnitrophota bacterium]